MTVIVLCKVSRATILSSVQCCLVGRTHNLRLQPPTVVPMLPEVMRKSSLALVATAGAPPVWQVSLPPLPRHSAGERNQVCDRRKEGERAGETVRERGGGERVSARAMRKGTCRIRVAMLLLA